MYDSVDTILFSITPKIPKPRTTRFSMLFTNISEFLAPRDGEFLEVHSETTPAAAIHMIHLREMRLMAIIKAGIARAKNPYAKVHSIMCKIRGHWNAVLL